MQSDVASSAKLTFIECSITTLGVLVSWAQSLYTRSNKEMMLRREVVGPRIQPNAINALDVIKSEHDTNNGKGGLHDLTVSMHSKVLVYQMKGDTRKGK